jgi:N-acetylglucosamine-6-phosphate deacetylase
MSRFTLRCARLATPTDLIEDGFLVVEGASVLEVGRSRPASGGLLIDLGDVLVAPGFVDVHVHGGGGYEVNCATRQEVEAAVRKMARFHSEHGTTALVATTVSDSPAALRAAIEGVAAVAGSPGSGVLGSNLEGPWISPSRAGAQFPGALRPPDKAELEELVALARGTLRLLTLAPELDGALEVIAAARDAGVVVAIGHTDADYETARAAFDAGASHATHLFNAMAPIHHRRPGPVAAALADPRVSLEIIADGVHINPALISLVAAVAPERLVLVTDAIGATGIAPGRHWLGPQEVFVSDGRAVLADHEETVAGSVLTMDRAVKVAVTTARVPLLTALQAASLHPATVLGERHKGLLEPGADADLVVLDRDFAVVATIVDGRVAYDPRQLLLGVAALSDLAGAGDGEGDGEGAELVDLA